MDRKVTTGSDNSRYIHAVIIGIGLTLSGVHVHHLLLNTIHGYDIFTVTLGAGVPLLVSLMLVGSGIQIWRVELPRKQARRVLQWSLLGISGLVTVGGSVVLYQYLSGTPMEHTVFVLFTFASVGGLIGVTIGWYDGHNQLQKKHLRGFKNAVDHAGHSILVTDTDGTITYANPAFEEITGYDREEALGATPRILRSGEHDEEFYSQLWETVLSGDVWESELVNERKNGEKFHVSQTIAPITDGSGEPQQFVAVNQDISDRKEYERQLAALHTATREMIQADSPEAVCEIAVRSTKRILQYPFNGVWMYDGDDERLEPVAWTDDAETLVGEIPVYERGNSLSWKSFETGEMRACEDMRSHEDVYDPETAIRAEIVLPLGEHGVMNIGADRRVSFTEKELQVVQILGENVKAALRQIELEESLRFQKQDLKRQNERLDEFASILSHDLRNPLNVALGRLELIDGERSSEHVTEAVESLQRMEELIDDTLTLARQGEDIDATEPVNIRDVIGTAWQHVDTRDADLEMRMAGIVEADAGSLQQLLENLFRNAVEHGGEDVTIRVEETNDGFCVEDTGSGLPADTESVFESGYTTHEDGTGLGLSIVQQIVDAHGWEISAETSNEGGARFVISTNGALEAPERSAA